MQVPMTLKQTHKHTGVSCGQEMKAKLVFALSPQFVGSWQRLAYPNQAPKCMRWGLTLKAVLWTHPWSPLLVAEKLCHADEA